nr:hypothetical protein [Tanacetum cinerariifolium]
MEILSVSTSNSTAYTFIVLSALRRFGNENKLVQLETLIIVMDAPTIHVFFEENLRDPIDIGVDIIHPEPVVAVAFLAAAVEQLLGVPIQEELTALRFRVDIAEAETASLRARIKTTKAIEKITRNRERHVRNKMEQQLAAVQESQRQD